jgi:hypothetical protein
MARSRCSFTPSIHERGNVSYSGKELVLRNKERPYCRLLAYFGLMARKTKNIDAVAEEALLDALDDATYESEGREHLARFVSQMKNRLQISRGRGSLPSP